jgi:serine/threonine protein kinase/tetratricopeptide (TPR) repeat protein
VNEPAVASAWQRTWDVFFSALERAPEERESFLAAACGADAELRAVVVRLLQAHDRSSPFLSVPPALLADFAANEELDDALIGRSIGRYRIVREIGEGGMGAVYEAVQESPVRRSVALKLVKAGMDTREVVARFEAERQALALMNHTNIARVLDAGASAEGRPYFVMELVSGVPLTEYCDGHRLSVRRRIELFLAVCEGVQHAHQRGVIHRDIKPSNVLVTLEGDAPVPKIIDFGVAKAVGGSHALGDATLHTKLGTMIGTPAYMSPEQFQPDGADVDTRTDVYGLSVLLYELLVGAVPFDPAILRREGIAAMQRLVSETNAPRPSVRLARMPPAQAVRLAEQRATRPRDLGRLLGGELDWIVLKGLAKDRDERYATPGDLAADLRSALSDRPVRARPPTWHYRGRKFVLRHRVGVAVAAVATIVLIAFAGTMIVQSLRLQRALTLAEEEGSRAEQVSAFLVDLLQASDPRIASGETLTVQQLLDIGAERIATGMEGQPQAKVRLLETMGAAYRELGVYERARALIEQALALQRAQRDADGAVTGSLLAELGELASNEGDLERAEQSYDEALDVLRAASGAERPLALALAGMLVVKLDRGQYAEAIAPGVEALALAERTFGAVSGETASIFVDLGRAYSLNGDFARAEAHFAEGIARGRHVHGPGHHQTAADLNTYALFLRTRGRVSEAATLLEEALAIYRRTLGTDHLYTLATRLNLGTALAFSGRAREGEVELREVLNALRDQFGADYPTAATAEMQLGVAIYVQGRAADAEPVFREALERDRRLTPDHPNVAISLTWHGAALRELGRLDEAERAHREALELRMKALGAEHADVGVAQYQLAVTRAASGDHAEADALLVRALELQTPALGERHPRVASAMSARAASMAAVGRTVEARPLFEAALAVLREMLPAGHPDLTDALTGLGALQCTEGALQDGQALLREARGGLEANAPADRRRRARLDDVEARCR